MPETTPNEQLASQVSQSSGTTVEELVKRRDGEYQSNVPSGGALPSGGSQQTVSPFNGVK